MVLDFLGAELDALRQRGLLREEAVLPEPGVVDACSNDYLGYGRSAVSRETLADLAGAESGAGASRLIHGTNHAHLELEHDLAEWVRLPAALLFTSGYAANLGALAALLAPGDLVVSDELNHASIIDGCRLSRATVRVYPHRDAEAARHALAAYGARRKWLVTESYFSMDGDSPDLQELATICRQTGAGLLVDEAHALGVHGPNGAGLSAAAGVTPDVLIGTLGKAVGAQGAFVAGSVELRRWLWNRARSHVYTTAPSPLMARLAALNVARARQDDGARDALQQLHTTFVDALLAAGVAVPPHRAGPIIPVIVGSNERAVEIAERTRQRGFLVQPIRPPTVPHGTARLRVTLHATMSPTDVQRLAAAIAEACAA